ncbi:MAG: hypothetical protein L6V93_19835 [Clostridiales bacterium]|nr:MAG: hypothetical protein L6V93_19835 [Clostridiales bacterium]
MQCIPTAKIWSVKKNASGETVVSEERTVNMPYEFCEYLYKKRKQHKRCQLFVCFCAKI